MHDQVSKDVKWSGSRSNIWLLAWFVPLGLPLLDGLLFRWVDLITSFSIVAILMVPAALLILLLCVVVAILERSARLGFLTGGALLFLVSEVLLPSIFWRPLYSAGVWVGLMPFQTHYGEQVDFGAAGIFGHALIFDQSDNVARFAYRHPPWFGAAQIRDCDIDVISLGGHYYACTYNALSYALKDSKS